MKNLLMVLLTVLGFIIFPFFEAWGEDWKLCGGNEYGGYFYDLQSIRRVSKNVAQVWEKMIFLEKGVQIWTQKQGLEFKKLSYSLCLKEFDCNEQKSRQLSLTLYDQNGKVISSSGNYISPWDFIVPGSVGESLFNIVCNSHEGNYKVPITFEKYF
jgi:hypothetical protein